MKGDERIHFLCQYVLERTHERCNAPLSALPGRTNGRHKGTVTSRSAGRRSYGAHLRNVHTLGGRELSLLIDALFP